MKMLRTGTRTRTRTRTGTGMTGTGTRTRTGMTGTRTGTTGTWTGTWTGTTGTRTTGTGTGTTRTGTGTGTGTGTTGTKTGTWSGTGTTGTVPRCESRLSFLLFFLLLLLSSVSGVSGSSPVRSRCPHLQCASEGRHFCKAGSAHCGSCLSPLVESGDGRCVAKRPAHRHDNGGVRALPDLDEEIDFLHSVIEEQGGIVVQPKRPVEQVKSSSRGDQILLDAVAPDQRSDGPAPTATPLQASNTTAPQDSSSPPASRSGSGVGPAVGPVQPVLPPPNDDLIIVLISLCIVVGTALMVVAGACYFRLRKGSRLAQKVAYPAFRGPAAHTAPVSGTSLGDKTLAQSAQMYHYQHHKQQMLSMGKLKPAMTITDSAEVTSDEDEIGGDLTVYECPGLAPTGEMEVKNPLFDDSTLQYPGNQK